MPKLFSNNLFSDVNTSVEALKRLKENFAPKTFWVSLRCSGTAETIKACLDTSNEEKKEMKKEEVFQIFGFGE